MEKIETVYDYDQQEDVSFIITKWTKHITDSREDETINKKPKELDHKFRLLCADGHVQAYGYISNNSSFAPLDYFKSSYGCADIQYYENRNWETL